MISALSSPAVATPISVPKAASSRGTSSSQPSPPDATSPIEADSLSVSQPESLTTSGGSHHRTSLKIRAHSQVKVRDGQVRTMSHTKLRFRYDFEATDGTKIRIRAKANLHYSQTDDTDEGSQSTRLRAKVRVSVLQETVSTGVAPLLDTPEGSSEAKDGISQTINHFHQVTDAVASLFLDSGPLDGDGLIAGLVEAFNGLSESLNSILVSPPADSKALPSGEVVELAGQVASDPGDVLTAEPDRIEPAPSVSSEVEPSSGAPPQDISPSKEPDKELVQTVGQGETSALEDDMLAKASEQENAGEGQDVGPATNEQPQSLVGSVMLRLRLEVIQSLTNLVGVFDSDSASSFASQSIFRATTQFNAYFNYSGPDDSDSLSHESRLDVQV